MNMRIPHHRINPQVLAKAKHLDTLQHGENIHDYGELVIML